MVDSGLTQQSVIEAGITASLAADPDLLPEPSIYFQDFNFGATMWDAAYGNVDGGSISGVGEAVADIAIDNVLKLAQKERDENDPAKDASMITELAARQREEAIRIGRISATRAELIAFSDAMKTPEFRARFRQELRDQGVPEDQIDGRMDRAEELADLAVKVDNNTATAAERSRFDELSRDDDTVSDVEMGLEWAQNGVSVNATAQQSMTVALDSAEPETPSADDGNFLAMMEGDAPAMAAPDRVGPVISGDYNVQASGTDLAVNNTPTPAPASAPAFSFDA